MLSLRVATWDLCGIDCVMMLCFRHIEGDRRAYARVEERSLKDCTPCSKRTEYELYVPRRLLILLLNVRSGRSIVFATASTINLLCRSPGQLKKLYMTDWFLVTSWSSSSINTTQGTRRGEGVENSRSRSSSACDGLTRSPRKACHSSEYDW